MVQVRLQSGSESHQQLESGLGATVHCPGLLLDNLEEKAPVSVLNDIMCICHNSVSIILLANNKK